MKTMVVFMLAVVGVMVAGCVASTPTAGTIYQRLQNEDPAVRVAAVVEAGNTKNEKTVPLLIDRLSDTESDVRMFSGIALRKITGQNFGWLSWDSRIKRDEAIRRWRQWAKKTDSAVVSTSATSTTRPSK
ncbi:MAG: HEAT repeat domain-containing protein [Phycisphaerae bacterium]|nr:HEAT repeat domain-containing protein [Phycisphaerae bacterium]